MQSDLPWNVPGISPDAREAARAAARREGLSLGEWLTRRIEAGPSAAGQPGAAPANDSSTGEDGSDAQFFVPTDGEAAGDGPDEGLRIEIEEQLQLLSQHLSGEIAAAHGEEQSAQPQMQALERLEDQLAQLSSQIAQLAQNPAQQTSLNPGDDTPASTDGVLRALSGLDEHLALATGRNGTRLSELAKDILVLTGKLDRLHADLAAQSAVLENRLQSLDSQLATATLQPPRLKSWGLRDEHQSETIQLPAAQAPAAVWHDSVASRRSRRLIAITVGIFVLAGAAGGLAVGWNYIPADWRANLSLASITPKAAAPQTPAHDNTASLTQRAKAGDNRAALALGMRYADIDPPQTAEAAKWLEQAAESEPMAQYRLADLYARGNGVAANPVKAANLYLAAAAASNRLAMYQLASAYAAGIGVKQDDAAAAHWFQLAAEAGSTDAQFNLAVLYERGAGVPQSMVQAYKWYAVAASQGDPEAKGRLGVLAGQMNPAEQKQAETAALAFKPAQTAGLIPSQSGKTTP
ncbi:MAG: hypothetical protein WCD42_09825 [Rhizomicrobium sp.]